jgi:hypothetical protein
MYFTSQPFYENPQIFGLSYLPLLLWKRLHIGKYFYRVDFQNLQKVDYISEKIIKSAQKNKNFYIFLDDSIEGYAYLNFSKVHDFVIANNLENKVIYVSGHLDVNNEYDAWLQNKKIKPTFYVCSNNNWFWRTRSWVKDFNIEANTDKTVWYSCLNNRPREHRLATVTYLDYLNLLDVGYVSANDKSYENIGHTGIDYQFKDILYTPMSIYNTKYAEILKEHADKIQPKLPLIVDVADLANKCLPHDLSPGIYNNALINLVTETYYFKQYNMTSEMFITEKTWKVFTAKQIPVIIGPKGILEKLRNFGFDVFDDLIDNSYDDEPDSTRLFSAINSMNRVIKSYSVEQFSKLTEQRRLKNLEIMMKGLPRETPIWKVLDVY